PVTGAWIATSTVGEPSQPWVGFRVSVAWSPAATATRSESVWAAAAPGKPTMAARAAADMRVARRERMAPASQNPDAGSIRGARSGACGQHRCDDVGRDRLGEQPTLAVDAAQTGQHRELVLGLDALGGDGESEGPGQ